MSTSEQNANEMMFDCARPFRKRLLLAAKLWLSSGRDPEQELSGRAFFAAQCWLYRPGVFGTVSDEQKMRDYVAACREALGGDAGWERLLAGHVQCDSCETDYRRENTLLDVSNMKYICHECRQSNSGPSDDIVG